MEQRINMKFLYKLGKSAGESHAMLKRVYGDETVTLKTVYAWFKRFSDGRESVEDEHRSGRPTTSRTGTNVERVRELLQRDRRSTIRMLSDELDIPRETVRKIVTQDLGKRKVCWRFVPHHLTEEQKQQRMECCGDLVDMADESAQLVKTIVTGDETWCFQYDPETKRQSMEWCGPTSPKRKKFRFEKSRVKTLLITFFDCQGIIHREFLPAGQTVNGGFYCEVLKRLLARIRRVRPHLRRPGSWFLLHDNARPHTATLVKRFLAQHRVTELSHPPYSPDLSPPDFFLFPKLKVALKGRRFTDIAHIQAAVTRELKAVPVEEFSRAFDDLYTRCQRCIVYDGDYFEGL